MPKKAPRRSNKGRARSRRPIPSSVNRSQSVAPDEEPPDLTAAVVPAPNPRTAPASARSTAKSGSAPPARTPATSINYAYLRHDLQMLGALAPSMVVLLVLTFRILH
jgi:hypothetical protein